MRSKLVPIPLLIALLLAVTSAAAEEVDTLDRAPAIGDTILADIVESGRDALLLFASPASFDGTDWAFAGGSLALGLGSMALDDDIRTIALRNRGADGDDIAAAANEYGTWTPGLAISGSLYLTGLAFDLPGVRRAGRHVAQAVVYAGLVTTVMKAVVGRQRPLFEGGPFTFDPFTTDDRYHSIASGHATLAFAVSSSLAADIDHPAATVALYGLATLTGLSRIYVDRHWTSDVLLGAAIGTACGYGVANLHEPRNGHSWMVVPGVDRLTVVWMF